MAGPQLSELNRPLGQDGAKRAGRPWGRLAARGFALVVGLALASLLLVVAIRRDPEGGRPVATATIEAAPRQEAAAQPQQGQAGPAPGGPSTARQLENQAGVTVVRPGSEAPGAIIISVPDSPGMEPKLAPAPDPRLVERGKFGPLPKIAPDGTTPLQAYARPATPFAGGSPAGRIALIVGGLGISQSGTADAIQKLPGAVSLAFAPYGSELERAVQRARGAGHEVFLQLPMEPFDYPDNDPGPHTLLTGPKAGENPDKLAWAMARFPGYVGVVNFLGGRLTADEAALTPLLREIAGRGLMVVDDGSSARSLLAASASRSQIPALKVDRVVDATTRPDLIDKELERLETLARERGLALGAASALPVSIERIAQWARGLEAKGIQLVPVSGAKGFRQPGTTGSIR